MRRFATLAVTVIATPLLFAGCKSTQSADSSSTSGSEVAQLEAGPFDRPGFSTRIEDGRLIVTRPGGPEFTEKHVTFIGAGPAGMTVKAPDRETIMDYLVARDGFNTHIEDGRVIVTRPGGPEFTEKHVTFIGAGPRGMTVKAPDRETALAYIAWKPGFRTEVVDGRLWVFTEGQEHSEKHTTFIGAGPRGMTLKALDRETAVNYIIARDGFETYLEGERMWVLGPGEEESEKKITLINAGPRGMTVYGVSRSTLDAYLSGM